MHGPEGASPASKHKGSVTGRPMTLVTECWRCVNFQLVPASAGSATRALKSASRSAGRRVRVPALKRFPQYQLDVLVDVLSQHSLAVKSWAVAGEFEAQCRQGRGSLGSFMRDRLWC